MDNAIFPLVAGPIPTTITSVFTCNSDNAVYFASPDFIPDAPNILTITDDENHFVTFGYTELTRAGSSSFASGIMFISGDGSYQFPVGSSIVRAFTAFDDESRVIAINSKVTAVEGSSLVPDSKVDSYDEHIVNVSNPHEVTKSQVGLGNADNTSDADKPISTAAQAALDLKVDIVAGSSLVPDTKVSAYDAHIANSNNPHSVTKEQLNLGNVDNTSDLNKPISTATQTALDAKATVTDFNAHTTNKSNPHEVTKEQLGLGNVDNTSDADKPVSDATQDALNLKVDKVSGSSLVPDTKVSSYDAHIVNKSNPHEVTKAQVGLPNVVDGAQINVIESISKNGAAQTIVNKNVNLVLSKSDVGLGNVDNTSDIDKPISDATQEALDDKVDKVSGSSLVEDTKVASYDSHLTNTSNPHSVTKSQVGLGNVDNTSDANKPVSTATQTELDKKVDKVTGSSLVPDTKVTAYDSHLTNTSNPHSVTKSQVGLGNVDNTSDTTKADTAGNPVHDKIETKAPISHASPATTYGVASASNYGHPKAASAAPSNATLAASVGTDNGLYARADHSHAKETFTMNGVTINSGDWVADSTYSNFPFKATISNSSISSSHIPIVILSNDESVSGLVSPVASTDNGHAYIYAKLAHACVISKIAFIKE